VMAFVRDMLLICWCCAALVGCVANSSQASEPKWTEVTGALLRVEVEMNSQNDHIWHYSGSTQSHHYFYRETARKFTGKRLYYKVRRADVRGVPRGDEKLFDGKAVSHSFAFTQMAKDRSGFTHLLSRGLVENVLVPPP